MKEAILYLNFIVFYMGQTSVVYFTPQTLENHFKYILLEKVPICPKFITSVIRYTLNYEGERFSMKFLNSTQRLTSFFLILCILETSNKTSTNSQLKKNKKTKMNYQSDFVHSTLNLPRVTRASCAVYSLS